jgi:hypothetical protein
MTMIQLIHWSIFWNMKHHCLPGAERPTQPLNFVLIALIEACFMSRVRIAASFQNSRRMSCAIINASLIRLETGAAASTL